MAPGYSTMNLLDLPPEILFMIVELSTTSLDDMGPLDEKSSTGVKGRSLVSKALREICLKLSLHHVRMWKKEDNLAQHLFTIYDESKDILRLAR
jgi:hypothetical protein